VRVAVADALLLTVEDDGVGPPSPAARERAGAAPDAAREGGVGWTSMRERATELGGRFEVAPRPGGGTRVTANLPLDPPEGAP
jgi:signal transduction histidine kinase